MQLRELSDTYQNVWSLVDNEEADLESIEMALTEIESEITLSASSIAAMVNHLDSDAEVIKAEEKRLADRRKAIENKSKWFRQYLQDEMLKAGIDKIKSPLLSIAIQSNPPSVQIENSELIPPKYLTIVPASYNPNKAAISADLKNGIEVPGCFLAHSKRLAIK